MYLKSVTLKNVGPIIDFNIQFGFNGGLPTPSIFVGRNGTGKSICLSFIVNFYFTAKQEFYEDTEVQNGRLYKLISGQYINLTNDNYYYAKVAYEDDFTYEECKLATKKDVFHPKRIDQLMKPVFETIPAQNDHIIICSHKHSAENTQELKKKIDENCLLFFPPNRFVEPAWLNIDHLNHTVELPQGNIKSKTSDRNIIGGNNQQDIVTWIGNPPLFRRSEK